MRVLTWNVAGFRAALKKGALDWLAGDRPADVVCLQETKAEAEEAELALSRRGGSVMLERYPHRVWRSTDGTTQRKGLSGTAIWVREGAGFVRGLPVPAWDDEGRTCAVELEDCVVVSVYVPNSQRWGSLRCRWRREFWDPSFRGWLVSLRREVGKPLMVFGDFNVGLLAEDVYKSERLGDKCAGFLPSEREGLARLLAEVELVDSFRMVDGREKRYTFWPQTVPVFRTRNIHGWRIDYALVDAAWARRVRQVRLHTERMGSDHCPVELVLGKPGVRLRVVDSV